MNKTLILISEWLWADYLVYDHFKKIFLKKIKEFGHQKLRQEKHVLSQEIDTVRKRCIQGQIENKLLAKKDKLYGHDVMGFKLKENRDEDCPYYTMKATTFQNHVRGIQEKKSIEKMRDDKRSNTRSSKSTPKNFIKLL